MPAAERGATLVAGAMLGVLLTLGAVFALVAQADGHYVTRREYDATLRSIDVQLADIRAVAYSHQGAVRVP